MENNKALQVDVFEKVKAEGQKVMTKARLYAVINSDEDFKEAQEYRKTVNSWKRAAEEQCEPVVVAARTAWQEALKLRDSAVAPLVEALEILDKPLAEYYAQKERERRIEEERRTAEAKRIQEEAQLAEATEADKSGDHERAAAILEQPSPPVPVILPKTEKIDGMSFRERWTVAEPVDLKRLVEAVAKGQVPLEAVQANWVFLRKMASALKNRMNYPGVRVYSQSSVVSKTK